ncbi:class A beta-lactamase [Streptomyces sp. TRM70350]|uniref:class A beta-lactamase n=1 Tax=Streptomyces sp. TRM70350 TaxID=2856165 RepID=UPI001C469255|nr:class A beta-lactamase [Streptomyces sp. TRM70350]MBV7698257.1 class A beta-lactamase [Streptomyces sp. TRM70350]
MSSRCSGPSRRQLLWAAALMPLGAAACDRAAPDERTRATPPPPSASRTPDLSRYAALERRHGARLGVCTVATGTGATLTYRADERFALCSTFKALAAAAVLHEHPLSHLNRRVTYTRADVQSYSPITEDHVETGTTVRELCDAAVRYSDNTAGNLLMRDVGGPAGLTAYLRGLGDKVSRLDHYEPELNDMRPGDPRDTTTPRAIATTYRALVLGDALTPDRRALLKDWLVRNTTGDNRIRAGVPKGWTVADKTGTGNYGRANDIGIVWPSRTDPLVLAVMTDRHGHDTPPRERLIAEATRLVVADLT